MISGKFGGIIMSKQQSNKQGKQSSAQKQDSSRHVYKTAPAASKVQGAHGEREKTSRTITEVMDDLPDVERDEKNGDLK